MSNGGDVAHDSEQRRRHSSQTGAGNDRDHQLGLSIGRALVLYRPGAGACAGSDAFLIRPPSCLPPSALLLSPHPPSPPPEGTYDPRLHMAITFSIDESKTLQDPNLHQLNETDVQCWLMYWRSIGYIPQ